MNVINPNNDILMCSQWKRLIQTLGATLLVFSTYLGSEAQSPFMLKAFQDVPQRLPYELGHVPQYKLFVGAPYISNINASFRSHGLSLGDIGLTGGQTFYQTDFKSLSQTAKKINPIDLGLNIDLLYFGYRFNRTLLTFHIGEKVNFRSEIPISAVELLGDVQQQTVLNSSQGYSMKNMSAEGLHYRYFGFGIRSAINKYVSVGFNVKYLKGIKFIHAIDRGISLVGDTDNPYFRVRGAVDVYASGLDILADQDGLKAVDYLQGSSLGNNGFAFDFGINLRFNDQFEIHGSLIDLGKINWQNDLNRFTANERTLQLNKTDINLFEEDFERTVNQDIYGNTDLADTLFDTKLVTQMIVGAYYHLNPDISFGLTANPRLLDEDMELFSSFSFSAKLNNFVELAGSATFGEKTFQVGAGGTFYAGPIQFYLATDNVISALSLKSTNNLHVTGGANLVFGRPKKRRKKRKKRKPSKKTEKKKRMLVGKEDSSKSEDYVAKPVNPIVEQTTPPAKTPSTPVIPTTEPVQEPETNDNTNDIIESLRFDEDPALELLVDLKGKAVDAKTKEQLKGVAVEFYRIEPNGQKTTLLLHGFYNGNIALHPNRYYTHELTITKQGYEPYFYTIKPGEMAGRTEVIKQFNLKPL